MRLLESPFGKRVFFALLYFNEGAPIGFLWIALPTILRMEGIEVDRIARLTAILLIPWTLKFLWAPLVDRIAEQPRGLMRTIAGCQLLMGATLLPVVWLSFDGELTFLGTVLLLHAIVAATQDVAIDALAIRRTVPAERGKLNGSMQVGMILGRSLFGGATIFSLQYLHWQTACFGIIAIQWLTMALVLCCRDIPQANDDSHREPMWRGLAQLVTRPRLFGGLCFALVAGAGFEVTGMLAGPFLVDHAIAAETIGFLQGIVVPLAMLGGSLAGGWLADRIGHRQSVALFLIGFVGVIFAIAIGDRLVGSDMTPWFPYLLGLMYLFVGGFTVCSYALFMDLADDRYSGTHFSAFMAGTNGCEAWSSAAGGAIATAHSYAAAFASLALVSLLSLAWLPRTNRQSGQPD